MNLKRRLLFYIIFFILYLFLALPIASLRSIFKDLNISLIVGFGLLNSIFAFLFLKWNNLMNVLCAFLVACVGVFVMFLIDKIKIAPYYDPYGIMTAIVANALISVTFWEVAYQVKRKFNL